MTKSSKAKRYGYWIIGVFALSVLFVMYFEVLDIKKSKAATSSPSNTKEMTLNVIPLKRQNVELINQYNPHC